MSSSPSNHTSTSDKSHRNEPNEKVSQGANQTKASVNIDVHKDEPTKSSVKFAADSNAEETKNKHEKTPHTSPRRKSITHPSHKNPIDHSSTSTHGKNTVHHSPRRNSVSHPHSPSKTTTTHAKPVNRSPRRKSISHEIHHQAKKPTQTKVNHTSPRRKSVTHHSAQQKSVVDKTNKQEKDAHVSVANREKKPDQNEHNENLDPVGITSTTSDASNADDDKKQAE